MYSNKDLYYFIMNKVYNDKIIKNKDAIIDFENGSLKYFEFIDRIEERAECFKCIANDVLAIDTKNDLELLVSILAGWVSNKTLFLLSQLICDENKLTMLEEAGITCIISDKIYKKFAIQNYNFHDLSKLKDEVNCVCDNKKANSLSLIIPTSGTEGKPKFIAINAFSAINSLKVIRKRYNIGKETIEQTSLPLTSSSVLFTQALSVMSCGGTILTLSGNHNPYAISESIKNNNPVLTGLTPTLFRMILESEKTTEKIQGIKYIFLGGENVEKSLVNEARAKLPNTTIKILYGLTETIIPIAGDFNENEVSEGIGMPYPEFDVRINKIDDQKNFVGEILIRSNIIYTYYYSSKGKLLPVYNGEKWLKTGDVGYFDNNHLIIKGRIKNIAIINGMNVNLEEIKEYILKHGSIKDCVVYYESHEINGNSIVAEVTLTEKITEKKIYDYCREGLELYKVPRKIVINKNFTIHGLGKIGRGIE